MMKKILLLHGYTQNGNQFSKRLGALRKSLSSLGYVCFAPNAPNKPTTSFVENNPEEEYAWWNANEDRSIYIGLDDSIAFLKKYEQENGPFDGVLGFSQGALITSIISSILSTKPRFLILASGFKVKPKVALDMIKFDGPTLHIIGKQDELVLPHLSYELAAYMAGVETFPEDQVVMGNVTVLCHDGGHIVPGNAFYRKQIVDWIKNIDTKSNL